MTVRDVLKMLDKSDRLTISKAFNEERPCMLKVNDNLFVACHYKGLPGFTPTHVEGDWAIERKDY